MASTKKRRQHHVWKHYLQAWCIDGKVWCKRADKQFSTSPDNVASQRDFYRLREMNANDLGFVLRLIERMGPLARDVAKGWIPFFTRLHQLRAIVDSSGASNSDIEREIDVMINNLEEELHAQFENGATGTLAALRGGNVTVLENDAVLIQFSMFLGLQQFRTPGTMSRVSEAVRDTVKHFKRQQGQVPEFELEAVWGLLRTIFATNVAQSIFMGRNTLRTTVLRCSDGSEFITGDQPVCNLYTSKARYEPPTKLALYYPLNPNSALLLEPGSSSPRRSLSRSADRSEVARLNERMAEVSSEQLFARSPQAF